MSPRTRPIRPIAAGITILTLCIPYTAATPIAAPVPASGYITGGGFAVEVDNSTYSHATVSNNVPTEYVVLHQRFAPGFIVLSYLIAVIGSLCTLELLIRRTSNAGWRNKLLLSSAGICFGAVSTFSMHFVFNNALTLSHPEIQHGENLALIYAPGYTVLSLVASCFAMTLAFFVMGTSVGEWYCVPGSRARRERRKQDAKRTGDEYRRWKTYQAQAHKGEAGEAVKKGTEKLSALMRRAGQVAKWSMMEHGLPGNDDIYANQSERDFRGTGLPKNKAKDFDPTNDKVQLDPPSLSDGILTNKRSSMSLPRGLMDGPGYNVNATWSTTGTNASTCMVGPGHSAQPSVTDGAEVFAPNYNFPPRPDSAASLIVRTTPSPTNGPESAMPTTAAQPWTRRQSIAIDNSAHAPIIATEFAQRRASLPAITPVSAPLGSERERAGRAGDTYMNTLSRIQSLPEVEQPHPNPVALSPKVMLSPEYELEKGDLFSPKQATLSISHHSRDADSELRRKRLKQDKLYGALERFLGFDVVTMEDIWKIVLTGTIAGCGVAGMHYIGQLSIIGMPYIAYDPGYVVGSVVIACGAVVVALYIMFIMLRPKLKHHFLYKLCVAFILAIAVCCMHFCGMMGTTYAWPVDQPITRHDLLKGTNGAIVGIVSALAFTACLACGVFFLIEALKARRERKRRRRVVVAAIMLDEYDRVLVNSTDGLPPMCDIASLSGNDMKSSKSTAITPTANGTGTAGGTGTEAASTLIGMDLSPGHEAFISALKLSWFWRNPEYSPTLSTLNHDAQVPVSVDATLNEIRRGSFQTATTSMTSVSRPTKVTVTKFLEKFVISSGQLATRLTGHSEGIQRIGVLYDQILTTGWVKLHNSSDTVSKGQLIILVRRVTSQIERDDLLTRHFIFADSSAVAVSLQKTLSVPLDHVNPLLQDVKLFCDSTARVSLQPGTLYAGVAIVQATPFDGLRILLEQDNRSQLPMRELCTFAANPGTQGLRPDELGGTVEEIGEALTWLEGMSLVSIINRNMTAWRNANSSSNLKVNGTTLNAGGGAVGIGGPRVTALLGALERAIVPMLDEMLSAADMEHVIPRLSLHPVLVPLTPGTPRPDPRNTYVPPYAIVLYAHYDAAVNTFTDKWLPFNLFRAQNACVMARSIGVAAKLEEELRQSQMAQAQLHAQSQVQGQGSQGYSGANPYSLAPSAYTFGSLPPMSTASARQMGSPTHGQVTAIQAEAGAGWSRRPSKVQFEDEVEQIGAAPPLTPLSMGAALASTPGAGPSSPTGLSSGFVFPPPSSRPGDMASSGGHTEASTPRGGGSANAPVPRRSSLAKTTFQSPGEHLYPSNANARGNGYQPYTSSPLQQQLRLGQSQLPIPAEIQHERWGEHERVPGVAPWEADWLLVLLRTKLRPDM